MATTTPAAEVFVVDDDPSVRTALVRTLTSAGYRVRDFAAAQEFLDSGSHLQPGCLILDLRLPDLDGMALYERLRAAGAWMPVIFLTGFGDIPSSVEAMKAGAMDFLPKPVADEVLLAAVEAALVEEARRRADRVEQNEIAGRLATLTARERQVMQLVLAGRLNKQIAGDLGISEKTVKVHRGRVMAKMGVPQVARLVSLVARAGLVPDASGPAGRPAQ
ncbi:MAG TPA: response regulator [Gemmatimonadales bacterium]|nr:response regulator [Gemmatimonadales bacterium]